MARVYKLPQYYFYFSFFSSLFFSAVFILVIIFPWREAGFHPSGLLLLLLPAFFIALACWHWKIYVKTITLQDDNTVIIRTRSGSHSMPITDILQARFITGRRGADWILLICKRGKYMLSPYQKKNPLWDCLIDIQQLNQHFQTDYSTQSRMDEADRLFTRL